MNGEVVTGMFGTLYFLAYMWKELKQRLGLADMRKGMEEEPVMEVAFKDRQHLTCRGGGEGSSASAADVGLWEHCPAQSPGVC